MTGSHPWDPAGSPIHPQGCLTDPARRAYTSKAKASGTTGWAPQKPEDCRTERRVRTRGGRSQEQEPLPSSSCLVQALGEHSVTSAPGPGGGQEEEEQQFQAGNLVELLWAAPGQWADSRCPRLLPWVSQMALAGQATCQVQSYRRPGSIPGQENPWRRAQHPTPVLHLETPMDRGAWQAF